MDTKLLQSTAILFAALVVARVCIADDAQPKPEHSEITWLSLLNDPNATPRSRSEAAEKLRSSRMSREEWDGVMEIARRELREGWGQEPILLEAIARSATHAKRFQLAGEYYTRLLKTYPNFRPPNRMIYVERAAIQSSHQQKELTIAFLEDLSDLAHRYETAAARNKVQWAEVYQEYYNVGNGYDLAPDWYRENSLELPITADEASARALKSYRECIQGLSTVPISARENISYQAVISGAYISGANILWRQGRNNEAISLLNDFIHHGDSMEQDRLQDAQSLITSILKSATGKQ